MVDVSKDTETHVDFHFHFECFVLERHDDGWVTARFTRYDPTLDQKVYCAEFDLNEFPENERELIQPGAIFDCFSDSNGEPRMRRRDLGLWDDAALDQMSRDAHELSRTIGILWDDDVDTNDR